MPRFRLTIEYDGAPFNGWQRQADGRSIQQALEEALVKFTHESPVVIAAGRTDAGVHARGQVVHFDLARDFDAAKIREALNWHLKPEPVVCLDAAQVADDFHARISARARLYCYRISLRRAPPALDRHVWHVGRVMDVAAMARAAALLIGKHDFTTFRAASCQANSPLKTLDRLDVVARDDMIEVHARARSFLHHQVRNMVGTLKLVGDGKWSPDDVAKALAARDRRAGGPTAPPHGLCLTEVWY